MLAIVSDLKAIWRRIFGYMQAGKLVTYLAAFKQASWPHTWLHLERTFDECFEDFAVWPSADTVLFECCSSAASALPRRRPGGMREARNSKKSSIQTGIFMHIQGF